MKKSIFLFLLAFMSLTANAQDPVKIDGLWYELGTDYNNMLIAKVVSDPNKVGYSGNVRIPKNVSYGGETYNVNEISSRAFCGTDILSVEIESEAFIGYHAFSYCKSLSSVTIGDGVTWIDNYAFYNCVNLASVVIGNTLYSIGDQAFQNCHSLTYVILGKNVNWIGTSAFADCENLKDLYFLGEFAPWSQGRIFLEDQLKSLTIHVPEGAAANYYGYPWSGSKEKQTMNSDQVEQCATPTINYVDGTVSFSCATPDVEFNSKVEYVQKSFNNASTFPAPSTFIVKAVAVKNGFLPSDVAEKEFDLPSYVGVKTDSYKQEDVNKDGHVNVADHVKMSSAMEVQ